MDKQKPIGTSLLYQIVQWNSVVKDLIHKSSARQIMLLQVFKPGQLPWASCRYPRRSTPSDGSRQYHSAQCLSATGWWQEPGKTPLSSPAALSGWGSAGASGSSCLFTWRRVAVDNVIYHAFSPLKVFQSYPSGFSSTLVQESRFLRHPGIPDGRKIWQKSRKIRKKFMLLVS